MQATGLRSDASLVLYGWTYVDMTIVSLEEEEKDDDDDDEWSLE